MGNISPLQKQPVDFCALKEVLIWTGICSVPPPSALGSVKCLLDIIHHMRDIIISMGRKEGRWKDRSYVPVAKKMTPALAVNILFVTVAAVAWPWGAQGGPSPNPIHLTAGRWALPPLTGIYKVFDQVISAKPGCRRASCSSQQHSQWAGGLIFDGWFTPNKGPKQHWAPDLGMVTLEPMGSFPISLKQCYFFPSW